MARRKRYGGRVGPGCSATSGRSSRPMKYVLVRIAIGVLVICATPLAVLAVLLGGGPDDMDFLQSGWGPMGSSLFVLGGLSLCSWLVGAIAAAVWKKRFCFAWRWGIILAIASFLVVLLGSVFIEALPLLKPWLTLTERFIVHILFSLLPSQVAFWGFSGVMRIGWKRRRVGS